MTTIRSAKILNLCYLTKGGINIGYIYKIVNKIKGESSVKECRGQPINGTLEQAVINGNF